MAERPPPRPWLPRAALLLTATALALAGLEGALRLTYLDLPSHAALAGTRYRIGKATRSQYAVTSRNEAPLCGRVTYLEQGSQFRVQRFGQAGSRPVSLWTVGDSITAGMGVGPRRDYSTHLARALARRLGARVELTIIGSPGGDYCTSLVRLNAALDRERPDVVLLQLFADDLVRWPVLTLNRGLIKPAEYASPGVRALVSRSYLANLAWFALSPPSPLARAARPQFQAGVAAAARRVRAAGGALVVQVLGPSGMPRCPPRSPPDAPCSWMAQDMASMTRWLASAGLPLVDHRRFWHGKPDVMLARERVSLRGGGMPIHPNAAGHRLLAEALLPHVVRALEAAGAR